MLNTVRDLAQNQQVTVIYVTHYPEEIQPFMNKTLLLRDGQVFAQGNTNEIVTSSMISDLMREPVAVHRDEEGYMRMQIEAPTAVRSICY